MNKIGRFEKIILPAVMVVAIFGLIIGFWGIRNRQSSFSLNYLRGEVPWEQFKSEDRDNIEEEKTFVYDEAGLSTQGAEPDYLAKAKETREEEGVSGLEGSPTMIAGEESSYNLATPDDPYFGPEGAEVTIVEFSDFLCPFCAEFALQVLPQIKSTYGREVKFIFRDFPIEALHPLAPAVHEAASCAAEQNLFWPFHDLVFAGSSSLTEAKLQSLAGRAGLDINKFQECLESGRKKAEVQEDLVAGIAAGIQATPTLFVNGRKIEGLASFEELRKVIEEELK